MPHIEGPYNYGALERFCEICVRRYGAVPNGLSGADLDAGIDNALPKTIASPF